MVDITVKNSAELKSAISKAKGGDRILLEGGKYDALAIGNKNFASNVTITSKDPNRPAVFPTVNIQGSSNITLTGVSVEFVPNKTTNYWESAIFVKNSSSITISSSKIKGGLAVNGVPISTPRGGLDATQNVIGLPTGRGITVDSSTNVTINKNDISLFGKGVVLNKVDGINILKNEVHDTRVSPITGGVVSNLLLEGNHLFNFTPWNFGGKGDHGDLVHFWTDPKGQTAASQNITIRNNFFEQGNGEAMLGIYLDDNTNNLGFKNVDISNNLILNGNAQGIRLENVKGVVANNTLVQTTTGDAKAGPGILLYNKSDVIVSNNIMSRLATFTGSTARESNNDLVQRQNTSLANSYGKVFTKPYSGVSDPANFTIQASQKTTYAGADITKLRKTLPTVITQPGRSVTGKVNSAALAFEEQLLATSADTSMVATTTSTLPKSTTLMVESNTNTTSSATLVGSSAFVNAQQLVPSAASTSIKGAASGLSLTGFAGFGMSSLLTSAAAAGGSSRL